MLIAWRKTLLEAWPALRAKNFRLFLAGQSFSQTGTFMQQVALAWLVYRLTRSPFKLGLVAFVTDLAGMAVVLFGGLLADRLNPHRILLATQSLAMLQALLLAALVFTRHLDITGILLLGGLYGIVNGFDFPARQVFVLQLVGRESLGNAIVLTSLVFDFTRLVGPSFGGAIVAAVGEWLCFLLNAASYAVLICALLAMKLETRPHTPARETIGGILMGGIRYAAAFPPIRSVLFLVAIVSFAGGPYAVLLPVVAARVLSGTAHTLGLLMGSIGLGALAGAIYLGRRTVSGYDRKLGLGAGIFGASLFLFALSHRLFFSVPLLISAGFGIMILMASSHTVLLLLTDADKRGRIMSIFTLSFMAAAPFGSLLAGSVASLVGVPRVIEIGGAICVLAAVRYLLLLPQLRSAYPQLASSAPGSP